MRYETQPLEKYIDIISGYAFKSKDFTSNGIPIIKIKNVTPPEVSLDDLSYIPVEIANSLPKFELNFGDVLIALTGSHINQMASVVGRVARVKYNTRSMLNQRVGKIVVKNPDACDLDYVYYFLSQDQVKISLASNAGGAANQANISPSDVRGLNIPFPPIEVQRRIANILTTYDDLIENNQKQIKLLEEAAMRLYKEWFVYLRFPGHENAHIVDGVPEGWLKDRADAIYDISIGKTPPRAESRWFTDNGRGVKWVSITDMGNSGSFIFQTSEELTNEAITKNNVKIVPKDSVLLSFKLTIGRVSITPEDITTNEAIAHFRISNSDLREYTYLYLKAFQYDTLGSTSSISTAINSKIVKAMPFILPTQDVLTSFSSLVKPIFDNIRVNQLEIINLRQTRDLLLPKLMSGNIEV